MSEIAAVLGLRRSGPSPLVVLVGAGVDQAIATRPGWTSLLTTLASELKLSDERPQVVAAIADEWPVEVAEALRVTLGPKGWLDGLRKAMPPREAHASSPLGAAIARLVAAGASTIVQFNYTDDLASLLRAELPKGFAVRSIGRSELTAWPLGRLLAPPSKDVHIIKLHGSIPRGDVHHTSDAVLDRSSYDLVTTADTPYRRLLDRIFEDAVVISIGVSWTDVPLRDSAAHARQGLPIARPMHYALRQHRGISMGDWWEERALTAAYGVRPLYYVDHAEVPQIIDAIVSQSRGTEPTAQTSLAEIADWLDRAGDYESGRQTSWFAKHWRPLHARLLRIAGSELSVNDWLASARIERHLRHFVWFWLSPTKRQLARHRLWQAVAASWTELPPAVQMSLWQPEQLAQAIDWGQSSSEIDLAAARGIFEFALGAFEIPGTAKDIDPQSERWRRMLGRVEYTSPNSVAARRVSVASKVWASRTPRADILPEARDACWEGIEAKLALDIVQGEMLQEAEERGKSRGELRSGMTEHPPTPRNWEAGTRDRFWGLCDHVRELSRLAGCHRREVGAVVHASFVSPVGQAESDLIAIYRVMLEITDRPEPTAAWSVVAGLLGVYADQSPADALPQDVVSAASEWLIDKCGVVPINDKLLTVVEENYARHWEVFHPQAASLMPLVAERLLKRK